MRIVLGTNVYIAAFLGKGLAADVLRLESRKKVSLYTSKAILTELDAKLAKKFKVPTRLRQGFIGLIKESTTVIKPKKKLRVVSADPDDNKILECAVEAGANLIVSMDKHLIKLKKYERVGIVHPRTLTWIIPRLLKS